jgi:hypothetical protein
LQGCQEARVKEDDRGHRVFCAPLGASRILQVPWCAATATASGSCAGRGRLCVRKGGNVPEEEAWNVPATWLPGHPVSTVHGGGISPRIGPPLPVTAVAAATATTRHRHRLPLLPPAALAAAGLLRGGAADGTTRAICTGRTPQRWRGCAPLPYPEPATPLGSRPGCGICTNGPVEDGPRRGVRCRFRRRPAAESREQWDRSNLAHRRL